MDYSIIIDIIIPIVAAIISGGITLLGVLLTINREKNKDKEKLIQSVKPLIFNVAPKGDYDCKSSDDIILSKDKNNCGIAYICMTIKNTDNGIAIIDRVETENNIYFPFYGNIIDKNKISNIKVHIGENENLRKWVLYVKDILENEYKYNLIQDGVCMKMGTNLE